MQKFYTLLKTSLNPIIWVAGAVMVLSGGALVWKGAWFVLWPAILALLFAKMVFPFLMIPAGVCAGIMSLTQHTRPKTTFVAQWTSIGYLVVMLSMFLSLSFYMVDNLIAHIPLSALGWAVAGGAMPWLFFATGDRENGFFTGLVIIMLIAAMIAAAVSFCVELSFVARFWIMTATGALGLGIQALAEKKFGT